MRDGEDKDKENLGWTIWDDLKPFFLLVICIFVASWMLFSGTRLAATLTNVDKQDQFLHSQKQEGQSPLQPYPLNNQQAMHNERSTRQIKRPVGGEAERPKAQPIDLRHGIQTGGFTEPYDEVAHAALSLWRHTHPEVTGAQSQTTASPGFDTLLAVAGSSSWLHLLAAAPFQRIIAFDLNPANLNFLRVIRGLVRCSETREDFISRIFGRNLTVFLADQNSELTEDNQNEFQELPVDRRLNDQTLSCLKEDERSQFGEIFVSLQREGIVGHTFVTPITVTDGRQMLASGVGMQRRQGVFFGTEDGAANRFRASFDWGRGFLQSSKAYNTFRERFLEAEVVLLKSPLRMVTEQCKDAKKGSVLYLSNIFSNALFTPLFSSNTTGLDARLTKITATLMKELKDIHDACGKNGLYIVQSLTRLRRELVAQVSLNAGKQVSLRSMSDWDSSGLLLSNMSSSVRSKPWLRSYAQEYMKANNAAELCQHMFAIERASLTDCALEEPGRDPRIPNNGITKSLLPWGCDANALNAAVVSTNSDNGGKVSVAMGVIDSFDWEREQNRVLELEQCLSNYFPAERGSVAESVSACPRLDTSDGMDGTAWGEPSDPNLWLYHRFAKVIGDTPSIEVYAGVTNQANKEYFQALSTTWHCPSHTIQSLDEYLGKLPQPQEQRRVHDTVVLNTLLGKEQRRVHDTVVLNTLLGKEYPNSSSLQAESMGVPSQDCSPKGFGVRRARLAEAILMARQSDTKQIVISELNKDSGAFADRGCTMSVTNLREELRSSLSSPGLPVFDIVDEQYSCGGASHRHHWYGQGTFARQRYILFLAKPRAHETAGSVKESESVLQKMKIALHRG